MPAPAPFDPTAYVRAPAIGIHSGITLAEALLAAMPKGMAAYVVAAAEDLRSVLDDAKAALLAWERANGPASEERSRVIDTEADRSWRALRLRVLAASMLPPERYKHAPRAAELHNLLFSRLEFLQAPYTVQWPAMEALLERIDQDGHAAELDAIAGPEYLKQIRHVHPRYRAMVHGQLARNTDDIPDLREHVRALSESIVEYASKVCATVTRRAPATVEVARKALRAIDAYREANARRPAPPVAPAPDGTTDPADPTSTDTDTDKAAGGGEDK